MVNPFRSSVIDPVTSMGAVSSTLELRVTVFPSAAATASANVAYPTSPMVASYSGLANESSVIPATNAKDTTVRIASIVAQNAFLRPIRLT